jgi:hypothetical protein
MIVSSFSQNAEGQTSQSMPPSVDLPSKQVPS